ncbi:MAG: glutamate racemase [Actinobacteria bacterium]|nr:glutamate racemase [Actinomycetota bacterium]
MVRGRIRFPIEKNDVADALCGHDTNLNRRLEPRGIHRGERHARNNRLISRSLCDVSATADITGPIGLFDSGFGGLTVARAVIDLLPNEDVIYIGDTGRYPYGDKNPDDVRVYARELAWSLVRDFGAKAILVACNTAAAALPVHALEAEFAAEGTSVPILGVIEPGARALVHSTRSGDIGVIGTIGTIGSGAYDRAVSRAAIGATVRLTSAACPGFVEFVERGRTTGPEVLLLAERLLAPIRDAKVDALLLGCTHYPYLARVITEVLGSHVVLVSSADETAFALREQLSDMGLLRSDGHRPRHRFMSSGDVSWFETLGQKLLGPELVDAETWTPR